MTLLSGDSPIRSQILPSVWAGYTLPRSEIMGERLPSKGGMSAAGIPQEWMDEMFEGFQNGSLVDFYEKYLARSLTVKNHEEILLEANKVLKGNIRNLTPPDNPLIAIAGADIANNADAYGLHLFQTACLLKKQGQLPKECEFMFERKINPALYEENEFEIALRNLSEPTHKIPRQWAVNSFYQWLENNEDFWGQMKKSIGLEFVLSQAGMMPMDCAVRDYLHDHRVSERHNRPRPRRFGQHTHGE